MMFDAFDFLWDDVLGDEFDKSSNLYKDMRAEADFIYNFIDRSFYDRKETVACFAGAPNMYLCILAAEDLRAHCVKNDPLLQSMDELYPPSEDLEIIYFKTALPEAE
ncbi:MAG: hypothetical protein ABJN26_22585 [Stappiaceae bacterium]